MAISVTNVRSASNSADGGRGRGLLVLVVVIFFLFGGITNLNDILIPKLKSLFALSYAEAMLVQFAFFTSYAIFSIPAGWLMQRLGYFRGIVLGFAIMAAGCLLFLPAAYSGVFWSFLAALFLLGSGITLLQVAVNPLIIALGSPATAHSRLTFAQFFNSMGVFLMVRFGAQAILGETSTIDQATLDDAALHRFRVIESTVIGHSYIGLAVVLTLIALFFWTQRRALDGRQVETVRLTGLFGLLRRPRLAFGVVGIFVYVGAEVGIASLMVNYLEQPRILALDARSAGVLLSYYWLGALVGRMLGGFLLRLVRPGVVLSAAAVAAIALILISTGTSGSPAAWSLLAVGLANSIMFPTIFSLAVEGLGDEAPRASGLLCTAIVGGAIIPVVTGFVADRGGLALALTVPAACYVVIALFGFYAARHPVAVPAEGTVPAFT